MKASYKKLWKLLVDKEMSKGDLHKASGLSSSTMTKLRKGDYDGAKETAIRYRNIFGEENYFLEMQDHGIPEQATVNAGIMRLSKKLGIPMVVTNDSHYIYAEDWEAHDVLLCIQTNHKVQDENRGGDG